MKASKALLFLCIILTVFFGVNAVQVDEADSTYEKGLKALENGSLQDALTIWHNARLEASPDAVVDPRIGFEYIRLAAEYQLDSLYDEASDMYLWALSGKSTARFREEYMTEAKRLKPLVSGREFRHWRRMIKDGDPLAPQRLKSLWIRLDPTPDTRKNERLIEHWERIAYAKEHFTQAHNTVYHSDDRGLVYVRYGPPDRIRKGTFDFNTFMVEEWAREIAELNTGPSYVSGSASGFNVDSGQIGTQRAAMMSFVSRRGSVDYLVNKLKQHAQQMYGYPRYEIWVYKTLNTRDGDNVVYIFGDDGDVGIFGLRRSLEEMIPRRAFRNSHGINQHAGATPGLLLQLMLYEQASIADTYFSNAFHDLESSVFTLSGIHRSVSFQAQSRNEAELMQRQSKVPVQKSTYLEKIPEIDIDYRQYRLLDDHDKPFLATFVYSRPQSAFVRNYVSSGEAEASSYSAHHMVQLYDEDWKLVSEGKDRPDFSVSIDQKKAEFVPTQSLFVVPNLGKKAYEMISSELIAEKGADKGIVTDIFSNQIKGMGKISVEQPEPLNVNPQELEMSDLVLGHSRMEKEYDYLFPFIVSPENIVPANKNLVVHFEVYHLQTMGDGRRRFQLNYNVYPTNWLGWVKKRSPKATLSINFESGRPYYRETLEVETRSFEPGEYELHLQAVDRSNGHNVKRVVRFKVEKPQSEKK